MAAPRIQPQLAELRRQAEQRLSRVIRQSVPSLKPESVATLVHELQVHQIELEMQCHELDRARSELVESRNTYRELYESIPVCYVTLDRDGRLYNINPAGTALLKWDPQSHPIRNFFAFFSNQDLDRFTLFCRGVVSGQEADTGEFVMKCLDGSTFFAAIQANPVKTGEGSGERMRVAFMDITGRKEADDTLRRQYLELEATRTELQALTRKLFTAQEDERKRIARDLHDDYCQRVTAMILEANILKKACEQNASSLVPRLIAMSHHLSGILNDFRSFSHELLPRNLGNTSLAVSVRQLVNEFIGKTDFEIQFVEQAVPQSMQVGTMTALYRVLQESLSNIVKHANAKHVTVTLAGTAQRGVELVVVDDGVGFDSTRAWDGQRGMGIVGMRERMRLIGGTFTVISQPGQGTTVMCVIPGHEGT